MTFDVRTICLGLLSFGPATGYEIKKSFEEGPIGYFLEASFGAIYPALGRLTEEGLIECRIEAQDGKPDRKIYSLTPAGEKALNEGLRAQPGPDHFKSEFMFVLMFADRLPAAHLKRLIDERLAALRTLLKKLEDVRCAPASPGLEFMRGHAIAAYRAVIEYIEANRHLLERAGRVSAHAAE